MSAAALKPEPRDLSLYSLSVEWDWLLSALADNGGELSPEIEAQFAAINDAANSKIESAALFIRTQETLSAGAKVESERLYALHKVRQRSAATLEKLLLAFMEKTGRTKVTTNLVRVALGGVGGNPRVSSVWDAEPQNIPVEYRKENTTTTYSLDKEKVLADYKAKQPLPTGITVHERGKSLSIR